MRIHIKTTLLEAVSAVVKVNMIVLEQDNKLFIGGRTLEGELYVISECTIPMIRDNVIELDLPSYLLRGRHG